MGWNLTKPKRKTKHKKPVPSDEFRNVKGTKRERMITERKALNKTAQKNFKATTAATKRLINTRLADGYTFEHFKCVIDTKVKQWLHNPEMNKYLRPDTLFNAM